MSSKLAKYFRSMNSRLIGEERWIIVKMLKVFYGISVFIHNRGVGRVNNFVDIDNFDRDLRMRINCSWPMGFSIYWTGFHEFREMLFLNKFLNEDMVFVDVGANMGEYSLFAAKRLHKGKVLAFEPLPKMFAMLVANISLNQFTNVVAFQYGLSDRDDVMPIHEVEDAHEGLSTFFPGKRIINNKVDVALKNFDREFENFGISRIDFIKIDIEGGELGALKGAQKSIERFKPAVMVEINQPTYEAAGYSVEDVYQFFKEISYTPFEINKQGDLIPSSVKPKFQNIVFVPS